MFKCVCKCGISKDIRKNYVLSGHTTSCSCYLHSDQFKQKQLEWRESHPEEAASQAVKQSIYWKTHQDALQSKTNNRKKTLSDHPEIQDKIRQSNIDWCKNNPDKVAERGKKKSQWSKDNPDKQLAANEKLRLYHVNNPDVAKNLGKHLSILYKTPEYNEQISHRISSWYKDNSDLVISLGKKRSELYSQHPEILLKISESSKQYWRDHPEESKLRGEKTSEFYKKNNEAAISIAQRNSKLCKDNRIKSDLTKLISVIHPSQLDELLSGDILSTDSILTKCPLCGGYAEHSFHNVFITSRGEFKLGHAPLCNVCNSSLTSSMYELEIAEYVSTFYNGTLVKNTRDIISPLELDLYYPEKKIAIEFNGDYWHSSIFKSDDYHFNKYKICKDKCILLVSIFESEWTSNKEHIKSYLHDLFSGIDNKLSFVDDHTVNNNYPSLRFNTEDSYTDYIIKHKNFETHTCGFSKIIS